MKKKFVLNTCVIALLSILIVACKKEKPTQEDLLVGKWGVVNQVEVSVVDGETKSTEVYNGKVQDFVNFSKENTVTMSLDGKVTTKGYQLLADNKILIGSQEGSVVTLTKNQCTIVFKTGDEETFDQLSLNLAK